MAQVYKFLDKEYSDKQYLQSKVFAELDPFIVQLKERQKVLTEIKQLYQGRPAVNNTYEVKKILEIKKEFCEELDKKHKSYVKKMKKQESNKDYDKFLKSTEKDVEIYPETIYLLDSNIEDILTNDIASEIVLATLDNDLKIVDYSIERLEMRKKIIKELANENNKLAEDEGEIIL